MMTYYVNKLLLANRNLHFLILNLYCKFCNVSILRVSSPNLDCKTFGMFFAESGGISHDHHQIATTTGAGHFPCQNIVHGFVSVDEILHTLLNHGREHRYLCIERAVISISKIVKVLLLDAVPTILGSRSQSFHTLLCDILPFHHGAAITSWEHQKHTKMSLKPSQYVLITTAFYFVRPICSVIVMSYQPGHTNTDGILSTADRSFPFRLILE